MSFKCQLCGAIGGCYERPKKKTVVTRDVRYFRRTEINYDPELDEQITRYHHFAAKPGETPPRIRNKEGELVVDERYEFISRGSEIVKELSVCENCFVESAGVPKKPLLGNWGTMIFKYVGAV